MLFRVLKKLKSAKNSKKFHNWPKYLGFNSPEGFFLLCWSKAKCCFVTKLLSCFFYFGQETYLYTYQIFLLLSDFLMNYEGKTKLGLILALGLSKCNHRNENYYNIHTIYLLPTKVKIKRTYLMTDLLCIVYVSEFW